MNDAAFREHEKKRESNRNDSTESGIAEKSEAGGTEALRTARQDHDPPNEVRGEMPSYEGTPDRNLVAKQVMAAELIGMGFSESQVCRILHIPRHELGNPRDTGTAGKPKRRRESR